MLNVYFCRTIIWFLILTKRLNLKGFTFQRIWTRYLMWRINRFWEREGLQVPLQLKGHQTLVPFLWFLWPLSFLKYEVISTGFSFWGAGWKRFAELPQKEKCTDIQCIVCLNSVWKFSQFMYKKSTHLLDASIFYFFTYKECLWGQMSLDVDFFYFALWSYEYHWISLFKHCFQHSTLFFNELQNGGSFCYVCHCMFFALPVLAVCFLLQLLFFNTMM